MGGKGQGKFVSRAGQKLQTALETFGISVAGKICADFGCNVGGFTDCLLYNGAARVYAIDTGYGQLAWKLRKDERVAVMERTNALYAAPPEAVDLVVCDVGWTPQELAVPAAMKWLAPDGSVVSLLKPHYEQAHRQKRRPAGPIGSRQAEEICRQTCDALAGLGFQVKARCRSCLLGKGGNEEFLLHIAAK
ncbi:MAG: TlyA family rRNA (cytidine-2'-O)-methyltransferase [Planctomycetes bacterium]|nr:TlyA family rRNA (cytidine-2'-O)-methyltransferase [Planctomycetota bacterium]